jgi:tellurite resistance protein
MEQKERESMDTKNRGAMWIFNYLFGFSTLPDKEIDNLFNEAALLCSGGDGEVSGEELQWLLGFAAAKGADSETLSRLEAMSSSIDTSLINNMEIPENLKKALIYCAINASSADGIYHVMEGEMIRKIANNMGLSDYIVEQIEDVCQREDELRLRRIQLLFPKGI